MKKTQVINLTQKVFRFKTDNFVDHDGYRYYHWRKDELCQVFGLMELAPNEPLVVVGIGKELFEFEYIPLDDFENTVDISRDFSTRLATADRPRELLSNVSVLLAGTNHA